MTIRADLMLNEGKRKVLIVPHASELDDHVALRLAAMALFADYEPTPELSPKHPALADQEFKPDCIALDEGGQVKLWVECGRTTPNKLDKLTKRYPGAKLVVLVQSEREAKWMRELIDSKVTRASLLELWAFRAEDFKVWFEAVREDTYVMGEAKNFSLNVVINDVPLAVDLLKF